MYQLDILSVAGDPSLEAGHGRERARPPELGRQHRFSERVQRARAGGEVVYRGGVRAPDQRGGGNGGGECTEKGAAGEAGHGRRG